MITIEATIPPKNWYDTLLPNVNVNLNVKQKEKGKENDKAYIVMKRVPHDVKKKIEKVPKKVL